MAETIPSDLIISEVSITNEHRTYHNESISGKFQTKDSGVQRFKGTLILTARGYSGSQTLTGFLAKLKGRLVEYELELGGAYVSDTISRNPLIDIEAPINSSTVTVNTVVGELKLGQVFNFANDSKLFVCVSDRSDNGIIDIVPSTRIVAAVGEPLEFISPKLTCVLNSQETTVTHTEGGLISSAMLNWSEVL